MIRSSKETSLAARERNSLREAKAILMFLKLKIKHRIFKSTFRIQLHLKKAIFHTFCATELSSKGSLYLSNGTLISFVGRSTIIFRSKCSFHSNLTGTQRYGGGGFNLYFQKLFNQLTLNLVCAISVQYSSN